MPKMSPIILERLMRYDTSTDLQLINAAKEIFQELVLLGLYRSGFFNKAAFQGGTALRLFYGLDRFSEDLDFALVRPDPKFGLTALLRWVKEEADAWGLNVEIADRSKLATTVQKAFLKDTSLGAELRLKNPLRSGQKFSVKVELDINPPSGATIESRLCEFPTDFYVVCYDEPSLFAGKLHAILCRPYSKGRDWYDLAFYFSRRTLPRLPLLQSALNQTGPFQNSLKKKALTLEWVAQHLETRIRTADFQAIRKDVEPFVSDSRRIAVWSTDFFLAKLQAWFTSTRSVSE